MKLRGSWAAALMFAAATTPPPSDMASLVGHYKMTAGATGTVEIEPALGGRYHEMRVVFTDVPHEIRYLFTTTAERGTHSVWRFEGEPAPAVRNEGTARFEGGALVTEFPHITSAQSVFRERFTVGASGQLDFALEAGGEGRPVRKVGGFTAARQ